MKAASLLLPAGILGSLLILLAATNYIKVDYCNPDFGMPCKGSSEPPAVQSDTKPAPAECPSFDAVAKVIEDSNYCSENTDCKVTFLGCPFGCGGYVNSKTDIPALKAEITEYLACTDANCKNDCIPVPEPICVNKKCVAQ